MKNLKVVVREDGRTGFVVGGKQFTARKWVVVAGAILLVTVSSILGWVCTHTAYDELKENPVPRVTIVQPDTASVDGGF